MDRTFVRMVAVVASVTAVIPTFALAALPASASASVDCTGHTSATFSPGVINTTRPTHVTINQQLTSCVALPSSVTSGSTVSSVTRDFSCTMLLGGGPASKVITWNTGATSTFSYTTTANIVLGQFVVTEQGSITAGLFSGSSATVVNSALQLDLTKCSTTGVESAEGPYLLHIG